MYILKNKKISIKDIASFLNAKYTGKIFFIETISSIQNIKNNSLLFYSNSYNKTINLKKINFKKFKNILIICDLKSKEKFNTSVLVSKNPQLDFYRVIHKFFVTNEFTNNIY